jgi:uncharacterized protein (TIGR02569 family)
VRPPLTVIEAFGAAGEPVALAGGRGLAWRVDDLVFKPADLAPDALAWQADMLSTIHSADIRLSIPQRASTGELVVDGWTAWSYLPGEHRVGRWLEIMEVADRFHRALAGVDRPDFIVARTDPWAIGDRVAWGEAPIDPYRAVPHVARLAALRRPINPPSQLIHGDLTGNVLFADYLPPAVIDLSLYWRPPAFAAAVVLADALVWQGADESLLDSVADVHDIDQMLIRALIFRIVAGVEGGFEGDHAAIDRHYRPAVDIACHRIDTGGA